MADANVKYEMHVVALGPLVSEFIAHGILVFFEQGAPEELAEFSILHEHTQLHQPLEPGDLIFIDQASFQILAIGEVANPNLANLGHVIIKFNGLHEPEMPGDICVEVKPVPPIQIGTVVKIVSPGE